MTIRSKKVTDTICFTSLKPQSMHSKNYCTRDRKLQCCAGASSAGLCQRRYSSTHVVLAIVECSEVVQKYTVAHHRTTVPVCLRNIGKGERRCELRMVEFPSFSWQAASAIEGQVLWITVTGHGHGSWSSAFISSLKCTDYTINGLYALMS
jgi:hypothetical protein